MEIFTAFELQLAATTAATYKEQYQVDDCYGVWVFVWVFTVQKHLYSVHTIGDSELP